MNKFWFGLFVCFNKPKSNYKNKKQTINILLRKTERKTKYWWETKTQSFLPVLTRTNVLECGEPSHPIECIVSSFQPKISPQSRPHCLHSSHKASASSSISQSLHQNVKITHYSIIYIIQSFNMSIRLDKGFEYNFFT